VGYRVQGNLADEPINLRTPGRLTLAIITLASQYGRYSFPTLSYRYSGPKESV
jgi:hypothetical protein